ncbi:MAG TPA: GntR family transcriptional regulator [Casimicrobiaceae bacterium]|nr:GntR family transcriptional regulator [Casimicrobiaceae bacterium]
MKRPLAEAAVYEIMAEALLSGRLGPGAKLGEEKLASLFGVSRERMRKVLHRLGHERLIDVVRNRGAFVANPGLSDAREIYEARRIVEGGIAWCLAARLSGDQLATLRRHFADEQRAHRNGNRADAIRLSGAFHVVLAQMTDNPLIVRQMHELVSRTSMLVALFEEETAPGCGVDEHEAIVAALASGDPAKAARAMITHLSLVETRLRAPKTTVPVADVEHALRAGLRRRGARDAAAVRTSTR